MLGSGGSGATEAGGTGTSEARGNWGGRSLKNAGSVTFSFVTCNLFTCNCM